MYFIIKNSYLFYVYYKNSYYMYYKTGINYM